MIGAVVIVIGLYSLIWGKSSDQMNTSTENSEKTKAVDDVVISNSIDYVTVVDIPPEKKPDGIN